MLSLSQINTIVKIFSPDSCIQARTPNAQRRRYIWNFTLNNTAIDQQIDQRSPSADTHNYSFCDHEIQHLVVRICHLLLVCLRTNFGLAQQQKRYELDDMRIGLEIHRSCLRIDQARFKEQDRFITQLLVEISKYLGEVLWVN